MFPQNKTQTKFYKYQSLGNYDEAIRCYSRALRVTASCYEEPGDYKKAYNTYCKIKIWYKNRGYKVEEERARKSAERCRIKYGLFLKCEAAGKLIAGSFTFFKAKKLLHSFLHRTLNTNIEIT